MIHYKAKMTSEDDWSALQSSRCRERFLCQSEEKEIEMR